MPFAKDNPNASGLIFCHYMIESNLSAPQFDQKTAGNNYTELDGGLLVERENVKTEEISLNICYIRVSVIVKRRKKRRRDEVYGSRTLAFL